ncbi:antibiotic biosynthesis monooxygenase [Pseudomaricurvus alcaniphilus]|uniref:antibiotic biosynthesis monooxygenase family protein n=1 Tax=Pseudomaricurvus alcaniphilus TaxID=1166482 RepID=UPI0014083729|nr:antibiotic biosynthesis monooxygenase [Pseudomaricurvus alcaniphilus]NHN36985.1 antibiotic biosynthesis monooxygenase [Pseudomaricurvus alcaniphilus]
MKFIFEVIVKPGFTVEEYAANWLVASEIMQRAPGALGTRLHRDLNNPNRLLAIASWESKSARDQKDDERDATVRRILAEHHAKCEINIIGEFDEPEWQVIPQQSSAG